ECSSVVRRANHNTRRERLVARVTFGIGYCARRSVRVSNENPRVRTAPCSSPCGHDNCPAQTKNPRRFPGGGLLSSRRLNVGPKKPSGSLHVHPAHAAHATRRAAV